jgi:hypothetical protein
MSEMVGQTHVARVGQRAEAQANAAFWSGQSIRACTEESVDKG